MFDLNKSMTSLDTKIKQVRNQNKNKTRCHQTYSQGNIYT